MSAESKLDRESFQELLENAFLVQEGRIDPRFLSAMIDVQRMIKGGELGEDGTANLIVDSARDVAGAAGVAIGFLQGDSLIYRAGSGSFAELVGSRVAASLTVSAKSTAIREILRVESAHNDMRVEGAIRRQFGAESLLILPIYLPAVSRAQNLAAVMMVLFSDAHAFQDSEIRMYRLMAGLVEMAMDREDQIERNLVAEVPSVPNDLKNEAPRGEEYFRKDGSIFSGLGLSGMRRNAIYERFTVALASVRVSRVFRLKTWLAEVAVQRATEIIAHNPLRSLALTALAVGLGLTFWISNGNRRPASPWESSPQPGSTESTLPSENVVPVDGASESQPTLIAGRDHQLAATQVRRLRAGQSEIDYIGDDVTVRHFAYNRTIVRQRTAARIAHIGTDVTVRYFAPKPAVSSQSQ